MNDPRAWAISYLAARGDVPWRWADDGDVVTWSDGTTIAYRQEIVFILEWLRPHGWPSFGALLWLLAACRGKLPPGVVALAKVAETSGASPKAPHERLRAMHATVEAGLAAVATLPEPLRTSLKAKAVLAETVFGDALRGSADGALLSAVVEVLRSGQLTDTMLNDPGAPPPETGNEWLSLHHGLQGITPEALVLRLRTGLDEIPVAAELPPIASARVRAMLEELRGDAEHSGLARLARDFMAALQLPRRLSEPDEMPIGGFADLSNRGNLDRLLLSELAHDDLTLAVRIALHEALYLRREPPAKQPPSTLAILIDSGVRLWGVPRVLASAVALALIAKSARHEEPTVFRASGGALQPVDLLRREGLTEHLGALETQPHPGDALDAFNRLVRTQERAEAVLITHRDVLADAAFQRSLARAEFEMLYLAVVDREGGFELLRHPAGGASVCTARMKIDDLWPDRKTSLSTSTPHRRSLIDPAEPDLPVIFSHHPFPLLLAVRGAVRASVTTSGGGGLCVMKDRRLLRWDDDRRGARTLAWSLPRGRTLWLGELSEGRICVVKTHEGGRHLACRVFLPDGDLVHSHDWRFAEPIRRVDVHGTFIFVIGLDDATVRSLHTGEELGRTAISRRLSHGRYFFYHGVWSVLAWDGLALSLVPVTFPAALPAEPAPTPEAIPVESQVLRFFQRSGFEGPWCITRDGGIYSHEGRCMLQLGSLRNVVRVSENGHRLLVAGAASGLTLLVDLPTLKSRPITGTVRDEDWEWKPAPPTQAVRVRFDQIAIGDGAFLYLRGRNGKWWMIFPEWEKWGSMLIADSDPGPTAVAIDFEPLRMSGGLGLSLKMARWPDGRCAWLDDRGMLHLRCADRSLPQLTLVLSEWPAAWSSDGLWLGHPFFVGDRPRCLPGDITGRIQNFCEPIPSISHPKP